MTRRQYYVALALLAVAGLAGGALGSWIFSGQAAFAQDASEAKKVITAQEFRLVDEEGKERALVGFSTHGQPGLCLYDGTGKPRAILSLGTEEQPFLRLYDEIGKPLVALGRASLGLGIGKGGESAAGD